MHKFESLPNTTSNKSSKTASTIHPLEMFQTKSLIFIIKLFTRIVYKLRIRLELSLQERDRLRLDLENASKKSQYTSLALNKQVTLIHKDMKQLKKDLETKEETLKELKNKNNLLLNQLDEVQQKYSATKITEKDDEEIRNEKRDTMASVFREASMKAHILRLEKDIKSFQDSVSEEIAPKGTAKETEESSKETATPSEAKQEEEVSPIQRRRSDLDQDVLWNTPHIGTVKSFSNVQDDTKKTVKRKAVISLPLRLNHTGESISFIKRRASKEPPTLFESIIISDNSLLSALSKCSDSELATNVMPLVFSLRETPLWLHSRRLEVAKVLTERVRNSEFLQQSFFFAISSRLIDEKDVPVEVLEDAEGIYESFFSKKRKNGYTIDLMNNLKLFNPFSPEQISKIEVKNVIKSNTRPLLLTLHLENNDDTLKSTKNVILKKGDDLKRDMAVMQIFKLMNSLWRSEPEVDEFGAVEAITYEVVATGHCIGLIEYVSNSFPIVELKHHQKKFGSKERQRQINSAAGGTIASFLLGIKDRHDDNTLFCDNGDIFQIDFSYMMGEKVTVDTAEISITRDTKRHFGPEGWKDFVDACVRAFCTIRNNSELVMGFCKLILVPLYSPYRVNEYLCQTLMLKTPYNEAVKNLKNLLKKAPSSYRTRFKNVLHHTAQAFSKKNDD